MLSWLTCAGGCSDYHTSGPEAWWHEAVGGKIAEQRPPPPGDKDPYPNLATVPARPAATNTAAWNQMTAGLITDRLNALQAAAIAPIPAASATAPTASALTSSQPPAASASLVGATPPPAAAGTTAKPPTSLGPTSQGPTSRGPVAAAPSTPFLAVPETTPVAIPSGAGAAQRVANGQLPALPTNEPSRPGIAPAPPPPLVPATAAPPQAIAPLGIGIDFDRGSAVLNDAALAEVKVLATIRGDDGIAITGYGDAISSDAIVQSNAAGLGLSRAQALATALVAQGVPFARLRLNAEAAGRGASLRLLH